MRPARARRFCRTPLRPEDGQEAYSSSITKPRGATKLSITTLPLINGQPPPSLSAAEQWDIVQDPAGGLFVPDWRVAEQLGLPVGTSLAKHIATIKPASVLDDWRPYLGTFIPLYYQPSPNPAAPSLPPAPNKTLLTLTFCACDHRCMATWNGKSHLLPNQCGPSPERQACPVAIGWP